MTTRVGYILFIDFHLRICSWLVLPLEFATRRASHQELRVTKCTPPGVPAHQVSFTHPLPGPPVSQRSSTTSSCRCPAQDSVSILPPWSTPQEFPWSSWWAYLGLNLLTWYACSLPVSLPIAFWTSLFPHVLFSSLFPFLAVDTWAFRTCSFLIA